MQHERVEHFLNQVMSIGASTFTLLGTRRTGTSGRSASELGNGGASNYAIGQLQRNVIQFAEVFNNPASDTAMVQMAADKVEGSLFTEQALSTISGNDLEHLIDELHDLVEARR